MNSHLKNLPVIHQSKDLEKLFFEAFYATYKTCLIGGAPEPLYQPAISSIEDNILFYRGDYFASALHEIAHWCIAGEQRLKEVDFGYWYIPEGRNPEQQKCFEQVEIKPQALEWMFSIAASYPFRLSRDNFFVGSDGPGHFPGQFPGEFPVKVRDCALGWCQEGVPERGRAFIQSLQGFYSTENAFNSRHYQTLPE